MSKPVKYRVISFKDDIIILERMTSGIKDPSKKKQTLRELIIEVRDRIESRLDNLVKKNNLVGYFISNSKKYDQNLIDLKSIF